MSMYAVKNDEGEWLNVYADSAHWSSEAVKLAVRREQAESRASRFGGHVVELVEAPAKIVVSEEEAEMLEQAKQNTNPFYILWWNNTTVTNDHNQQERLMRAYVNGWTVEKPKRWNVKVPHTTDELYWKRGNGNIGCVGAWQNDDEIVRNRAFTLAEIEHYELTACEKVLCADSARTTGEAKD